jgi:hypothetical protein
MVVVVVLDSHFKFETDFNLPNPNGKEGGACISALLQVLYERGHEIGTLSWISVMEDMWEQLKRLGYDQVPQLSSSRWIDVYRPMYIVPPNSGKRRAMVRGARRKRDVQYFFL